MAMAKTIVTNADERLRCIFRSRDVVERIRRAVCRDAAAARERNTPHPDASVRNAEILDALAATEADFADMPAESLFFGRLVEAMKTAYVTSHSFSSRRSGAEVSWSWDGSRGGWPSGHIDWVRDDEKGEASVTLRVWGRRRHDDY